MLSSVGFPNLFLSSKHLLHDVYHLWKKKNGSITRTLRGTAIFVYLGVVRRVGQWQKKSSPTGVWNIPMRIEKCLKDGRRSSRRRSF